jgi:hypothetical protein
MLPNYNNKMSDNPQKRNKDSKEAAKESIEQSIANDQDTESIEVAEEGEAKGTATAGTGL